MATTYEGIPTIHVLNNEKYRLHSSYLHFDDAQWELRKLESAGWKAHITTMMGLHVVYKRR